MVDFLTKLNEELYLSEAKISRNPPNKKVARLLAQIEDQDYALYLIYSKYTYWNPSLKGEDQSAAVEPHSDGESMIFHYNPSAWEEYDYGTILFLLLHELGHIIREHHSRAAAHVKNAKYYHKIMNISMDTWINEDIVQGKLGQYKYAPKPPFRSFSEKDHGDLYGSTVEWLARQVESSTGKKPDLEYNGPKSAESFYDWILKVLDKNGMLSPPEEDKEIKEPEIGDIIRGPGGKYGEVLDKDPSSGQVTRVEILTKEEAYRRVRENAGMEIPESLRSRSSDILLEKLLTENTDVNWDFKDVTILKSSLGKEEGEDGGEGGGGPKPPKTNEEDIDPPKGESEESEDDGGGDGEGGEGEGEGSGEGGDGDSNDSEIKIGDIVQDMNTGKYGKVTAIDGDDLFMDPVSDEELKKKGFKSLKMNDKDEEDDESIVKVKSSDLSWGNIEQFI